MSWEKAYEIEEFLSKFNNDFIEKLDKRSSRNIFRKLEDIILDLPNEFFYFKRKSLEILGILFDKNLISKSQFITILEDINIDNDKYFLLLALKYIFYFYEDLSIELDQFEESTDCEIKNKFYYYKGFSILLKLNSEKDLNNIINNFREAKKYFNYAIDFYPNDVYSTFYYNISCLMESLLEQDIKKVDELLKKINTNVIEFEYAEEIDQNTASNILHSCNKLREILREINDFSSTIDYYEYIKKLTYLYASLITDSFGLKGLSDNLLNILYKNNLSALECKLDKLLAIAIEKSDKDIENFVKYLKNQIFLSQNGNNLNQIVDDANFVKLYSLMQDIVDKTNSKETLDLKVLSSLLTDSKASLMNKMVNMVDYLSANIKTDYSIIGGDPVVQGIYNDIKDELKKKLPDYDREKFNFFMHTIESVLMYSNEAIKSSKERFPFLYEPNALEKDLQNSMLNFFNGSRFKHQILTEVQDFSNSGRVDILFTDHLTKIPIELKRDNKKLNWDYIESAYLGQVQSYTYAYEELGIFVILDLSNKKKDYMTSLKECWHIHELKTKNNFGENHPNYVVSFIIEGNKVTPREKTK